MFRKSIPAALILALVAAPVAAKEASPGAKSTNRLEQRLETDLQAIAKVPVKAEADPLAGQVSWLLRLFGVKVDETTVRRGMNTLTATTIVLGETFGGMLFIRSMGSVLREDDEAGAEGRGRVMTAEASRSKLPPEPEIAPKTERPALPAPSYSAFSAPQRSVSKAKAQPRYRDVGGLPQAREIKDLRKALGDITQAELADALGVSISTIQAYEQSQRVPEQAIATKIQRMRRDAGLGSTTSIAIADQDGRKKRVGRKSS